MEKNSTTMYITAKKRIGCNAPIDVTVLVFMSPDFNGFSTDILLLFSIQDYCIVVIKIFPKLV